MSEKKGYDIDGSVAAIAVVNDKDDELELAGAIVAPRKDITKNNDLLKPQHAVEEKVKLKRVSRVIRTGIDKQKVQLKDNSKNKENNIER